MSEYHDKPDATTRLIRVLVLCLTAFLLFQLISIHLSWPQQAILGLVTILIGLLANRVSASRVVTLALMAISMTATFRYGWWRVHLLADFFTDESNTRVGLDAAFLLLLISAEIYTILIMLLGYMQTAWPLHRTPIALPSDDIEWPHVDLLIPTYNEPLSLVRYTALAALNIDYPPDKLHVYILDDGTREDFSEFAAEAGVGYLTREVHSHAKAGNINHALTMMESPFVAIFDCDHVPTRSFLQMTLGWLLADEHLGMLQTPHHFYSPDPFERNLLQYKTIPNEAALFYGIVQDGNDFWNATFFCGSCALIRRAALDAVGGIATETVTEDAHTSLRMQRRGYNTAYINIPQAAGLATESLAAHVGQRIRWARGMIQILRTDNPLFGRGLKFTQRLCYFNAMIHFMYSVPRLVFLLAPLVYLLLGRTIIPGYWVAILVYALPHLILASLTNSRIQGRHRHSFWNEIYESVLAPYILAPTLLALINPKFGKFNVTSKGSTQGQTQFDRKIATPTRWLLMLNFCGLLVVPYRFLVTDPQHPGAVIMNMVWVLFNIVILGVAAAVALEQKQRRSSVRIEAKVPVTVTLPGGKRIETATIDMSIGGASITIPSNSRFASGDEIKITFPSNTGNDEIPGQVIGVIGGSLRIAFQLNTIAEQEILTRALYSRADAWIDSAKMKEVDRPLISLGRVMVLSTYGIYQVCRSLFPEKKESAKAAHVKTAAILLAALALGLPGRVFAFERPQKDISGDNEPQSASSVQRIPGRAAAPLPDSDKPDPDNAGNVVKSLNADGDNIQVISLKDMGFKNAIEMRGPHSYATAHFVLSHQSVPKQGVLELRYGIDPSLDPQSASLQISLNGSSIATLHPAPNSASADGLASVRIPVSNLQLVRNNTLTFEFTGSGVMEREEQAKTHILCRIFPSSTFEVTGDWLRLGNDLSQLPLPLLDSELQSTTTIPFVFLSQPSPTMLEAAGLVASWFGVVSGSHLVRFTVSSGDIPFGNAIILTSDRATLPSDLQVPLGSGPVLALRNNPSGPVGTLLVLAGDNDGDVLTIAKTLALSRKARAGQFTQESNLSGDTAQAPVTSLPSIRTKDDAPRWLPISKTAPLVTCPVEGSLQTDGSSPIPVYFHAPPDLYYGERQNIALHLNYRYDAHVVAPGSALRVTVNGTLVNEIALPPGAGLINRQRVVLIPVDAIQPFGNTVLFSFDFVPANPDPASNTVLSGEILCDTGLALNGLEFWTRMPNLQLFADAGFPFTQFADLSRTNVVLPSNPSSEEVALYLQLMSQFGAKTGYPGLRVTVTGPSNVISEGRDYLILGTVADQPAFNSLAPLLPATLDGAGIHVKPAQGFSASVTALQDVAAQGWSRLFGKAARQEPYPGDGEFPDAIVEEIESPVSPDRSIVTIVLRRNSDADEFAGTLLDPSGSSDMNGSLTVLRNSTLKSFAMNGATYQVGDISQYAKLRIYLTRYFMLLLFVLLGFIFLSARFAYGWMAWHAQERLKLAAATRDIEQSTKD
jgi:cellulose synthase (UDP-forming)